MYTLPTILLRHKKKSPLLRQFIYRGAWGKEKFPRLAKTLLLRVAESNRNFYIFLSQACIRCPLQRRHHESCSESLAVKIGGFEQSCPELSKVFKSTRFVRTCGIFTHRKAPPPRPKDHTSIYVTPFLPAGRKLRDALPSDSTCLVWWGRVLIVTKRATRFGSSNNS